MRRAILIVFGFLTFALGLDFAAGPEVMAQGGTTGTGRGGTSGSSNSITKDDFFMRLLRRDAKKEWTIFTDYERRVYFNQARCACNEEVLLELDFSTTGAAKRSSFTTSQANIEVLIGVDACVAKESVERNTAYCPVQKELTLAQMARAGKRIQIPINVPQFYGVRGNDCTKRGQQHIRLRVDMNGDRVPDLVGEQAPFLTIDYDGEPPAPPTVTAVQPGNEALSVSWEANQGVADFRGFVVLCSRSSDLPVYKRSYFEDQYRTVASTCGNLDAGVAPEADAAIAADDDAGTTMPPEEEPTTERDAGAGLPAAFPAPPQFTQLDPRYVCSDLLRTQRSTRLKGLENGIPYLIGVATIDLHGNASPIKNVYLGKPVATRDFYQGYRTAGGEAEGGYCALAGRRNSRGVLALMVVALGALVARRRRK